MKIKILYEDSNILAIDKPAGIMVHPDGRSNPSASVRQSQDKSLRARETITDWVLKNYPKLKGVGEPITFNGNEVDRPGIVHRLDRETSGVLIIVKNKKAFEFYKKQFMDRTIKKTYHAIVSGWIKNDKGIIDKPIGRSPSDFRRRLSGRGARGTKKEAVTEYKVLKRFTAPVSSNFSSLRPQAGPSGKKNSKILPQKFSYLEIYPKTGRTHQIRVHMKYLNHSVAGDSLYNPKDKNWPRMMLHAKSIEFRDPKGKTIKIESALPKEFKKLI